MSSVRVGVSAGLMGLAVVWAGLAIAGAGDPSIRAEGRGHPWIHVLDGRELPAVHRGDTALFARQLAAGTLSPAGMTTADLDGDGLADLIATCSGPEGAWATLHRANLDTRSPNGPRARIRRAEGRFRDEPFLLDAQVVPLPATPRWLGTGEVDGDGHADLVLTDGVVAGLWWLRGTGQGGLGEPKFVPLPGAVTALVAGRLDRREIRDAIVVGVQAGDRAELLSLRHDGETVRVVSSLLALDEPVSSLALGRLGPSAQSMLAVGTGDRVLLLADDGQAKAGAAPNSSHRLPAPVEALAFGTFGGSGDRRPGLALALHDGTLQYLRREDRDRPDLRLTSARDRAPGANGSMTLTALDLSSRPGQDLLLANRSDSRISIRMGGLPAGLWTTFDASAPVAAVLPMQLNGDSFSDLVVQLEGAVAPTLLLSGPRSIFTVDSIGDDGDVDLGDGLCATSGGDCTLRAAIEQANVAGGTDTIGFDIAGAGPHTIQPMSPLPAIIDPLTLDATTEPDYLGTPVVELDGSQAGSTDGLIILTGASTVEGLAINRFESTGLVVGDLQAVGNRIQGNFIGTDVTGTVALGNLGHGLYVYGGAQANFIGTDGDGVADDREGNLISANGGDAIVLIDLDTDSNVVAGNLVGTDLLGSSALANVASGIVVLNGARFNRIGTDGDGLSDLDERNISSGNGGHGLLIAGDSAQNIVAGNYIGVDLGGSQPLPNGGAGIELSNGASFNRVGTNTDGLADDLERNIISGNAGEGIRMFGIPPVTGNTIAGNRIGTDAAGTSAIANGGNGISLSEASAIQIGGGLPAARNLISGNAHDGISIGDTATTVRMQGNFIGTDATGTVALGNGGQGILIFGSPSNVVGTDGDGVDDLTEGNLIAANSGDGVAILRTGADQNVVAGNFIGTDLAGIAALGNGGQGVAIVDNARFNRVGTDGDGLSDALEGNLVSGNGGLGVLVAFNAADNVIAGNRIGTDTAGLAALGNLGNGVELSNGALRNRIGTDVDGQSDSLERNLISGNGSTGISLFGTPSTDENIIAGNYIGTQIDGLSPLGNSSHGIVVNTDASYNVIGALGTTPGTCDGACNVIAFNGTGASLDGVRIVDGICNSVVGNVIHSNHAGAGIDIAAAATTPNDPGDVDVGANNSQNFPVLTEAISSGGSTTIHGDLDSIPSTDFWVELFANITCDPSGFGEGEQLIAGQLLSTDGTGQLGFAIPVTPEVPAGQWITATATRVESGTLPRDSSEFSPCLGVGAVTSAGSVPDGLFVPGVPMTASRGAALTEVVLDWSPSCVAADVDYAVYLGTLGDFTSHWARRCSTEGATTTAFRNNEPAIYFFVVPVSGNREGSYGFDSLGFERPLGVSACHPRQIGACD